MENCIQNLDGFDSVYVLKRCDRRLPSHKHLARTSALHTHAVLARGGVPKMMERTSECHDWIKLIRISD